MSILRVSILRAEFAKLNLDIDALLKKMYPKNTSALSHDAQSLDEHGSGTILIPFAKGHMRPWS